MMTTTQPLLQKLISGVLYLVALTGNLYLIGSLITYPLFPSPFYLFLIPSALILAAAWRLPFLRAHAAQALLLQVYGVLLGCVPWVMRQIASTGILGERWFYTGWEGNGVTGWWSLMALILAFGGLAVFGMCCEAVVQAFAGKPYRCPGLGKRLDRVITTGQTH